jgi:uncharacterized protein
MPTVNVHPPGSFCWIELGTTDQQAAKQLYGQLFGWTADDMPMGPDEFYTMFKLNGLEVAACYKLRPGQVQTGVPVYWMLYMAVADVDGSAKRASELGGTVLLPPFDVFTAGRMAVIQDPTGVVFSMWQAKEHIGLRLVHEEGALCWADLLTKDRDRAAEFYSALFGWTIEKEDESHHRYYHIKRGTEYVGGMPAPDQQLPGTTPHWSIYFQTANCEKKTALAQSLGAKPLVANMKRENVGTLSIVADPQGATFCLFESARKGAAG